MVYDRGVRHAARARRVANRAGNDALATLVPILRMYQDGRGREQDFLSLTGLDSEWTDADGLAYAANGGVVESSGASGIARTLVAKTAKNNS